MEQKKKRKEFWDLEGIGIEMNDDPLGLDEFIDANEDYDPFAFDSWDEE